MNTNVCPVCGSPAIVSCRCPKSNSECKNGHKWHYCLAHNPIKVVLGASDHSKATLACSCIRWDKDNDFSYQDILSEIEELDEIIAGLPEECVMAKPTYENKLEKMQKEKEDHEKQYTPVFENQSVSLFESDSLKWLETLEGHTADMIFVDPPYNINKAEWDSFSNLETYLDWCNQWIIECFRILKPTGTMYICGFSENLADIKVTAMRNFPYCRWLIWYYTNKANLGKDWGRSHESILCLRKSKDFVMNLDDIRIPYKAHTLKYPEHPQAETSQYGVNTEIWQPHPKGAKPRDVIEIPTLCNGVQEKTKHPTQKPEALLQRLILASSNPGDLIIDPFSGSGTTLCVAQKSGRFATGCDRDPDYNKLAIGRLTNG